MITWIRPGDTPVTFDNPEIAMRNFSEAAIAAGGFEAYAKLGGRLIGDKPESSIDSSIPDASSVVSIAPSGAPARASEPPGIGLPGAIIGGEGPTPGGQVSAVAAARIASHEEHFRKHGVNLPPPVYAPGTKVIQLGLDNFKLSRSKWAELPTLEDALHAMSNRVKAEQRVDVIVNSKYLRMTDDGLLRVPELDAVFRIEEGGFDQLISHHTEAFPRGKSLMYRLEPDVRAFVFNRQMNRLTHGDTAKLRLRVHAELGTPMVYSVVSERYTPFNVDSYCDEIHSAMSGMGYRAESVYNPKTTKMSIHAQHHADRVVDLAAGDVFKTGINFTTADNGTSGIGMTATVLRNLCLNLIILGEAKKKLLRRKHVGTPEHMSFKIMLAMDAASDMFAPFMEEWNVLRHTPARSLWGEAKIDEIASKIAAEIDIGFDTDATSALLLGSFNKEPGDTAVDWINALTRLHDSPAIDLDKRELVEVQAYPLMQKLKAMAMELS